MATRMFLYRVLNVPRIPHGTETQELTLHRYVKY